MVQARMIGLNEDGVPMIHLYRSVNGQTVMVNRELVDRFVVKTVIKYILKKGEVTVGSKCLSV